MDLELGRKSEEGGWWVGGWAEHVDRLCRVVDDGGKFLMRSL